MRIGVLGGTFNPFHNVHLKMAQAARRQFGLERVVFVPARIPPHKRHDTSIVSAEHRLHMTRLAVADIDGFEVSDVELRREGPSYTVDTLEELKGRFGPGTELFFILGTDQIHELPTWRDPERIARLCTLVPVVRPGYPMEDVEGLKGRLPDHLIDTLKANVLEMTPTDVSATDIRRRLAAGEDVKELVPPEVERYIREEKLYRQ